MNSQGRFILAVVLMLGVLIGGNFLFPPAPSTPSDAAADSIQADTGAGGTQAAEIPQLDAPVQATGGTDSADTGTPVPGTVTPTDPTLPQLASGDPAPSVPQAEAVPRTITVAGPLYRYVFTDLGARVLSLELPNFESFTREGPVDLIPEGDLGLLGHRLVAEATGDTVDLRSALFEVTPADGLVLEEGGGPQTLTFRYQHPTDPFAFEVRYTFDPEAYVVGVQGRAEGVQRALLIADLGSGPAFNEVDDGRERQALGLVVNDLQEGIESTVLGSIEQRMVQEGPFLWSAIKSSYFAVGILPRAQAGDPRYLGGIIADPLPESDSRASVGVTQSLDLGGNFDYRFFGGPQDYQRLVALGDDFEEVNPPGWKWMRPVLRPIVGAIMWVLTFFHTTLSIGYGWVLILVGVLMRIVLFPLNHKAMRAQLRNMAVQPLLKDIQTRYKDQPEKMQKELMKLYKEHGFNPLAGCWPMLLPWPVLIALFFVFQNTIELRGVSFMWLPDLSAKDPFYVLPVLLATSMFLMQWISLRTMEEPNPQMKMMMYFMPIFMLVIFSRLPSGLNLYYLTANLATLPQSWWIANERKKVRAQGPPTPAKA